MDTLLGGSLWIGRAFGINIRLHFTFIIYVLFRLYNAPSGDFGGALYSVVLLFAIVLAHEYGHCLGARTVGGDAENILLWPLGGLAFAHAPMTAWAQFVTVACGPLVNVLFCIISAVVLMVVTGSAAAVSLNPFNVYSGALSLTAVWQFYLLEFYAINLFLFYFNMLPVYPMDGGQLFRTAIWPFVGLHRATIIAAQVGIAGAVLFGLFGVYAKQPMLVAIAFFGGMTSFNSLNAARGSMQQDEFRSFDHVARFKRERGFWSRWQQKRERAAQNTPRERTENPNPGGWQRKLDEQQRLELEVDRILKKVKDEGINSLTYVERQSLERATRERNRNEMESGSSR